MVVLRLPRPRPRTLARRDWAIDAHERHRRPQPPKAAADFALSLDALSRAAETHLVSPPPAAVSVKEEKDAPESRKRGRKPAEEKKKEEPREVEKDNDDKEEKEKSGKRKRLFAKECADFPLDR